MLSSTYLLLHLYLCPEEHFHCLLIYSKKVMLAWSMGINTNLIFAQDKVGTQLLLHHVLLLQLYFISIVNGAASLVIGYNLPTICNGTLPGQTETRTQLEKEWTDHPARLKDNKKQQEPCLYYCLANWCYCNAISSQFDIRALRIKNECQECL